MRVIYAIALAAVLAVPAANATTVPEFVGNTIVLRVPDGTVVKWFGNSDGTYARLINTKDKMVARNGKWHMEENRLCIKDDGGSTENCWTYQQIGLGKWQTTKSDHGDTAQAEVIKGR